LGQLKKIMIFGELKQTNKELDELINHQNTTNYVKAQSLGWFGHINRMS